MTLTQYEEDVIFTLTNEYDLTPAQAGTVAHRHSGAIAAAWEVGNTAQYVAECIRIREDNFAAIKAVTRAQKIEVAYKIFKKKLEELGCDTEKLPGIAELALHGGKD